MVQSSWTSSIPRHVQPCLLICGNNTVHAQQLHDDTDCQSSDKDILEALSQPCKSRSHNDSGRDSGYPVQCSNSVCDDKPAVQCQLGGHVDFLGKRYHKLVRNILKNAHRSNTKWDIHIPNDLRRFTYSQSKHCRCLASGTLGVA